MGCTVSPGSAPSVQADFVTTSEQSFRPSTGRLTSGYACFGSLAARMTASLTSTANFVIGSSPKGSATPILKLRVHTLGWSGDATWPILLPSCSETKYLE